jgi:hypothetical protein
MVLFHIHFIFSLRTGENLWRWLLGLLGVSADSLRSARIDLSRFLSTSDQKRGEPFGSPLGTTGRQQQIAQLFL